MLPLSPHEFQEREQIADERDDAAEQFARFAPVKRDWWQAREEAGLPTLAEEMEGTAGSLCDHLGLITQAARFDS
jgi:hypothetical protein